MCVADQVAQHLDQAAFNGGDGAGIRALDGDMGVTGFAGGFVDVGEGFEDAADFNFFDHGAREFGIDAGGV